MLAQIQAAAPHGAQKGDNNDSYGSGCHTYYLVPVPKRRQLAKAWLREHKDWTNGEVRAVVDSLLTGESHEEKTVATMLIWECAAVLRTVEPEDMDRWLEHLAGWAEVDSLCQSSLSSGHLLQEWTRWRKAIGQWARSPNINKRRASLVLLTGPVHYSSDARLADLALETISRLRHDRDILITKAISWLLRAMTTQHREVVTRWLDANESTLPRIAVRETRIKLATGTKTGRRRRADESGKP